MDGRLDRRHVVGTIVIAMLLAWSGNAHAAEVSSAPAPSAFGILGNGGIGVIVPAGGVTYIGGNFDELAARTGPLARLDVTNGRHVAPLPSIGSGEVRATIRDGRGGLYIGGTFISINGEQRLRVAHILPDGRLDPTFRGLVSGPNTPAVNALALSEDGRTLYLGGSFNNVFPFTRNNIAAIDAVTGELLDFNPAGLGTDGQVNALELSGGALYVGGQFEKLGGQVRNGLAKVSPTSGGDLGWIPNPTLGGGAGIILTIDATGDAVYVGGLFTGIGGAARRHLARLSPTSGQASAAFTPDPDGAVFALLVHGASVFAGGDYNAVGGQTIGGVARLDTSTGRVLGNFNARLAAVDIVMALALAGDDLLLGGFVSSVDGQPRSALAKVKADTGAATPFDAAIGNFNASVRVNSLTVDGTRVYVGGDLAFVNRITRHGIAALDRDGVPTAFNPDAGVASTGVFNDVSAIAVTANAIYIGGNFVTIGGQPRNRLAKLRLDGTLDPQFNPNPTGGNIPGIDAIVVTSTDVFVGGDFSSIGGQPRLDLARLNPVTGAVDGGRQSFDPDPLDGINPSRVRAIQVSGDAVYVAGDFTTIGGRTRNKIAKLSAATGSADPLFDANVSGGSDVGPDVFALVLARSTLYVGGDFTIIGGAARINVATLNPATGAEVASFDPSIEGGTRPSVHEIVVTNDEVWIGGSFFTVDGAGQAFLARLNHNGTLATSFSPRIRSAPGEVLALAYANGTLYAGGLFFEINGQRHPGYAQFGPLAISATDADNDAIPDDWQVQYRLYPQALASGHAAADPDGDGRTNLQEYREGTHPMGFFTRYLAEGATSGFFRTRLAILNLSATDATVLVRLLKSDETTDSLVLTIPPLRRITVDASDIIPSTSAEFSIVVESDQELVVDRTMTWDVSEYGAHAETAVAAPSLSWYLAEGATHSGFDLFYLVQNPNAQSTSVHVKYLLPSGAPIEKEYVVPARSRFNIWVDADDPRLANTDVSAVITSSLPTIVERAMYLSSAGRTFNAGHESVAVRSPETQWFLAEGATGSFFDLFVLVSNPQATTANVAARFLLPSGEAIDQTYTVGPNSRFTIWVDQEDPRLADTAVSTVITSTNAVPIIVERAMWWPGPTAATWAEAHNSAGLTSTGRRWALAEGEEGGPTHTETYILLANSLAETLARVTLVYEDGTTESRDYLLAPNSRTNVAVVHEFPNAAGRRFGAIVETLDVNGRIFVERAMYSSPNGVLWAAGTNAAATKLQ